MIRLVFKTCISQAGGFITEVSGSSLGFILELDSHPFAALESLSLINAAKIMEAHSYVFYDNF